MEGDKLKSLQKIINNPCVKVSELKKTSKELGNFLRSVRARKRPVFVSSSSERIDIRKTLRERLRRGPGPLEIYYKERQKVKELAFLLDCSESMSFYFNWLGVVISASLNFGEKIRYFGFNRTMEEIVFSESSIKGILKVLNRKSREKASKDILSLPEFLKQMSGGASDVKNVVVISDLVIERNGDIPVSYRDKMKRAMNLFEKVWVLDIFRGKGSETSDGVSHYNGGELIDYLEKILEKNPDGLYLRTAEEEEKIFFDREILELLKREFILKSAGSIYRGSSIVKDIMGKDYYNSECSLEDFFK